VLKTAKAPQFVEVNPDNNLTTLQELSGTARELAANQVMAER
jgi:hypothetical protein